MLHDDLFFMMLLAVFSVIYFLFIYFADIMFEKWCDRRYDDIIRNSDYIIDDFGTKSER